MSNEVRMIAIRPGDDEYPEGICKAIGDQPLQMVGNVTLLERRGIGVCGSRNASEKALECAYQFGVAMAKQGIVVVGGFARGVDRQAHLGALEEGGATIAVLPEGIRGFRLTREFWDMAGERDLYSNLLAVSMFEASAPWSAWRAMKRNKLVVGLSDAVFVVEAQAKGGTMNAGLECLRQKKRLWAMSYGMNEQTPDGNRLLIKRGGVPVKDIKEIEIAVQNVTASASLEEQGILL